jgi:EpsI family protein
VTTKLTDAASHASAKATRGSNPQLTRRAVILGACMVGTAVAANVSRRWFESADAMPAPELAQNIPLAFGRWKNLETAPMVVNPQQQRALDKLYSEVVSRTYVDPNGYHIMLSAAYGRDQRGGLEAHKPELCYPAQGFTVHESLDGRIALGTSSLSVRRLRTSLSDRHEPLTYWFSAAESGNSSVLSQRIQTIRSMLTGSIPDGVLIRASSIDRDPARAWQVQDAFIKDLMLALPEPLRRRLAGRSVAVL